MIRTSRMPLMRRGTRAICPLTCSLACGVLPIATANAQDPASSRTLRDASPTALPLAMLQGRSMDAEWIDLNGDRRPDLIVASEFGQNVVLMTPADGRLDRATNALPQGRLHDSEDIAVADFDGDGHLDIVFVAEDDQTNELYLSDGHGAFVDASDRLPADGGVSNAVLAHDIDADGDVDLLIGNRGANVVLLNDGTARFTADTNGRLPVDGHTTQDLELGDIDGDGDLDLFVANEEANQLLVNDGRGFFADETALRTPQRLTPLETREADLFDANGDGHLDLVLANVGWRPTAEPPNLLLINDGRGHFSARDPLPGAVAFTLDVDAIDIDADGDFDLVLANVNGPPLQILRNDGTGAFEDITAAVVPTLQILHGIDVEVMDINADGHLDIYIANHIGADRLLTTAPPSNASALKGN